MSFHGQKIKDRIFECAYAMSRKILAGVSDECMVVLSRFLDQIMELRADLCGCFPDDHGGHLLEVKFNSLQGPHSLFARTANAAAQILLFVKWFLRVLCKFNLLLLNLMPLGRSFLTHDVKKGPPQWH